MTSAVSKGAPSQGRAAHLAVTLAILSAMALASATATFAAAYAVGGARATEDNWVGYLVATLAAVGLFGSLVAFVSAIIAKASHHQERPHWLPFILFPTFLLFIVLGEVFWWE